MKPLLRLTPVILIICLAPLAYLASCQSKFIYLPRPYPKGAIAAWQHRVGGTPVTFTTSQGSQTAFLQGNLDNPRNLWIVCGGNGSLALYWSDWLARHAPARDAYLLVDYPGYGKCEGKPNPERIAETFRAAIPKAASELGMPSVPDPSRLRVFGHSLGAAAAMIAASEFSIQRGVLLSPFTSTMDMAEEITGAPLGFLVTHRYDNLARLAELAKRGPGNIIIIHGKQDDIIPPDMSAALAASQPSVTKLILLDHAGHNDIADIHAPTLSQSLATVGE